MNKKQKDKKLKKKKLKDSIKKQKIRVSNQKTRKEHRKKFILEKKASKGKTIRNQLVIENPKLLSDLEHNLEILKSLETEYLKENSRREEINKTLEAEGYKTLEEKMNAIKEKAQKQAQELLEKNENLITKVSELESST